MKIKLEPPFDELFFVPRIANELNRYITNPRKIPPIVCLYGLPGIGKTAFAKLFAETFAEHTQYHAMNEHTRDANSKAFKDKLLFNRQTLRMSSETHAFETATVLDEFHNLSHPMQDVFKVMFDRLIEDDKKERNTDLIILCCNTTNKKKIKKTLASAIYSRVHPVRFECVESEILDHAADLAEVFTNLKAVRIASMLPDIRKIQRENELLA